MTISPIFRFGTPGEVSQGSPSKYLSSRNSLTWLAGFYRLKNRIALARELGLPEASEDSEIIIAGWHRWNCDVADRLRGAFGFVLHDEGAGVLYAARDVFGQEPLYLAAGGSRWVFGDNPRAVRSTLVERPPLDHVKIADFLMDRVVESNHTYFVGVERLPAGHWTKITPAGRTTQRYWAVSNPPRNIHCDQPAQQFRESFDSAVNFQAGGLSKIGVLVSGGMDSSSVLASLISDRGPRTQILGLTQTYNDLSEWSDGPYIALLKQAFQFDHREFPRTAVSPLDHAAAIIAANDGPVQAYGFAANVPLYKAAVEGGVNVILDGHGGDEVVSLGLGLLNELAQRGDWIGLWDATRAPANMYSVSRLKLLKRYLPHLRSYRIARKFWRTAKRGAAAEQAGSILAPELERLVGNSRYQSDNPTLWRDHTERNLHEHALGNPIQQYAQELLVVVGRAYGVDCRMPFLDRDLAELSLSLKPGTKLKNGLTRAVLRDAMAGRLPHELLARPDKFDFSTAFSTGLLQDGVRLMDLTDPETNALEPFINISRLQALRAQIAASPDTIDTQTARTLFRVAQLSIWLRSL